LFGLLHRDRERLALCALLAYRLEAALPDGARKARQCRQKSENKKLRRRGSPELINQRWSF